MVQQKNASRSFPVAIIGSAFRFPGDISDEPSFWNALKAKNDLVSEVPAERWGTRELQHDSLSEPGRSITFSAGILSRIDEFDAGFFGISPREAAWLDPQQRLLLELSWEAMENAGVPPSSIAGSDCAVYVGISSFDHGIRAVDDLASLSGHFMTGNTLSMAANRLSYVFDLHGPSLALDTACSSSLVALHNACCSLRLGEASAALVGGVQLLLHPYPFVGFSKATMLSADGRSKPFDASANGYVRAEGGAVVLLKPLQQALEDGDEVQAIILASGVNTDGGRKTGLTIPSREGQVELMEKVLAQSGLSPQDVDYIEAHGTGTPVGDPVEAAAIGAVYGRDRSQALPIGSLKANMGHLEPASGIAGLIKAVLMLKNRGIPPALHLQESNPHIDFSELNIELIPEYRDLKSEHGSPLVIGVNSFGFGGANAHVLLQEPPGQAVEPSACAAKASPPLFLSASSDAALRALAGRYSQVLGESAPHDYYDIAYAAAHKRERLEKRLALLVDPGTAGASLLARYADGDDPPEVVIENRLPQPGGVAFIYSGNGAQWLGMGRRLLTESQRFREVITSLDEQIHPLAGYSVIAELNAEGAAARLEDTVVAQPLLFVIQVACTRLLHDLGIKPAAVAGHSVGEIAAAWAAGALDLQQAIRVIVARSSAQSHTRGAGRMAVVGLSEAALASVLAELGSDLDVTVAGVNSPSQLTLSGSLEALEQLQKHLRAKRVFFRFLDLDYAFHSWRMDAIEKSLLRSLHGLVPGETDKAVFVSTVSGEALGGTFLDDHYWWRNVREPVRFKEAVIELAELGCRTFIEIGPQAILKHYISESLASIDVQGRVLSVLGKGEAASRAHVVRTALRAHLLADKSDLDIFFPEPGRHRRLPNYPWQRERHWHPSTSEGLKLIARRRIHPLLGWPLLDAEMTWENTVDPVNMAWLADHNVGGTVVFPGSAYAEMVLAAAREWLGGVQLAGEELDIVSPMVFVDQQARTVRFILNPRDGGFQIKSRQRLSSDQWSLHATGRILEPTSQPPGDSVKPVSPKARKVEKELHYRLAGAVGLDYGPTFQGLAQAYVCGDRLEAVLDLPEQVRLAQGYLLHPALLDACYQSLVDFYHDDIELGRGCAFLPVKVGKIDLYRDTEIKGFHAHLRRRGARSVLVDFLLFDSARRPVAAVCGCRFRVAPLVCPGQSGEVSRWEIVPKLTPRPLTGQYAELPSPRELNELSGRALEELAAERRAWFTETHPLLEALTLSFVYQAFQRIAVNEGEDLQRLVESSTPFLGWLSGLLHKEGLLQQQNGHWSLLADDELPEAKIIWNTLLHETNSCLPQLTLLGRIGSNLPALLEDESLCLEFLGKLRQSLAAEHVFENDPAYLGTRTALANILQYIAGSLPEYRRLRVLEIAAGPSELSRQLLQALPEDRLDYVMALADENHIQRQESEYLDFANLTLASFSYEDFELSANANLAEKFDVVIFGNVLHRASDPYATLTKAQKWLALGGVLVLAERYADWSSDILAGIDPNWWREDVTENSDRTVNLISSLRSPDAWEKILQDQGFAEIETFTEPAAEGLAAGAYLLIAGNSTQDVASPPEPEAETWLLLADEASQTVVDNLQRRLTDLGQHVAVSGPMRNGDLDGVHHVVRCLGWNAEPEDGAALLADLLSDVKMLARHSDTFPRLWLVARGGALASRMPSTWQPKPVQAGMWGFGRVLMNEHPELNCTLIDLASDPEAVGTAFRLADEILYPGGESEIVLTGQARYTLVLQEKASPSTNGIAESGFRLDFHIPGKLRNLVWLPIHERPLQADEVEVRTMAAGLNFRDIMYLLGLLPEEAVENGFAGASLGLEFAGIVTRVGTAVREFQAGDGVMGFGSSCFASHVITSSHAITAIPQGWSFPAAASVPTAYFTAYYALCHLADLQPGERVLIHGGAGGVGIAAIRLARHLGAEIFATAGSEEKRDVVRLLGADHVFDSRSLDFADEVLAATGGAGVDVVLNSLAGEAVRRNLRILKPFGRFLELGKRDFYENTPVGLRFFKENISYFGIDVDQLFLNRPRLTGRLFGEIMELFREGVLVPLPYRVFERDRVVDAFSEMREARHIGKVIVALGEEEPNRERPASVREELHFGTDCTWLVTGGLEGFGLESSRWLAARGVKNLVLLGRRGENTPGAAEALAELADQGVNVVAFACDVTDSGKLSEVLACVRRDMPPLKGILHAAMVLDDQLIANLAQQGIEAVLLPKLMGAWNLHSLTLDLPLDYFVLYSSVTTALGNPGQGNYVAANATLEGLAQMRRRMGLPASCIGWGPIGDAGYLSRSTAVRDSLAQRLGREPLTASAALRQLEQILIAGDSAVIAANFDWGVLAKVLPSASGNRFALLNRKMSDLGMTEETFDFRALIAGKHPREIRRIVQNVVRQNVAKVLHIKADRIDLQTPLHDLGLDSLMAVELAQGLEQSFAIQLPTMILNESPTVERVSSLIVAGVTGDGRDVAGDEAEVLVQDLVRQHGEEISETELQSLIRDIRN